MSIWIRSQDKMILVDAKDISSTKTGISKGNAVYYEIVVNADTDGGYFITGQYESEAQAMKVLDMIDKHRNEIARMWFMGMEEYNFINTTFQMPSVAEVEAMLNGTD